MNNDLLLTLGLGIIGQALLLYVVISFAVQPTRRDRYLSKQIDLLIKLAQKAGVTDEEINEILIRNK